MTSPRTPGFRIHPSPVGDIMVVSIDDHVVSLHPTEGDIDAEIERVSLQLRHAVEPDDADATAALAATQLDEYFAGVRRAFDLPLDWRLVRGFTRAALEAACEIPYGETASYGEVAIRAGSPGAARAVGTACARTPFSIIVPVHRVVRTDGSLGEYGGRPQVKKFLVALEHDVLAADARSETAGE